MAQDTASKYRYTQEHPYTDLDFKFYYEREYAAHQETKAKLQAALNRIEYLGKELEQLKADNAYLKKLLFSQKSEQRKKKLPKHPQTITTLAQSLLM